MASAPLMSTDPGAPRDWQQQEKEKGPTTAADAGKKMNDEETQDFLEHARTEYQADVDYDRPNREAALDDLVFVFKDPWDPEVRRSREAQGRPCISINTLPQTIGQVIGDRRLNETSIQVLPKEDGDKDVAEVRGDLIRNIEAQSKAKRVYDRALENQVACGIGNFKVVLDYADDDVFMQDIFIRTIANPLAVIWDRMSVDPTGRDARHCYVQDTLPRKVFERRWPDQAPSDLGQELSSRLRQNGWFTNDTVRIVEYWRMVYRDRTLALMLDGSVIDITDKDKAEYEANLFLDGEGKPRTRKSSKCYAQMWLITGHAILDGPYELPVNRLPVFRVNGRVGMVGEDRVRFGLTRFAKDGARYKNYWRSSATELISMATKAQWVGPDDAFEGYEDSFRNSHRSGDPLLRYRKNASAPPQRVDPPAVPTAILNEAAMAAQDIKDTTGIQDASLGIRSNETSGKAIMARQREGDVATIMYHDELNSAIEECGDVINQLIPVVYDTARTIRVIGKDGEARLVRINDQNDPESIDLAKGKYDVAISTGPSFTTKRVEAAENVLQLAQAVPLLGQVAPDLLVETQDLPNGDQFVERLKRALPPQLTQDDSAGGDGTEGQPGMPQQPDPAQAAQAQAQQMQEHAQQMQMEAAQQAQQHAVMMQAMELRREEAAVQKAEADARAAAANADKAEAQAEEARAKMHGTVATTINSLSPDMSDVGEEDETTDTPPGAQPAAGIAQ